MGAEHSGVARSIAVVAVIVLAGEGSVGGESDDVVTGYVALVGCIIVGAATVEPGERLRACAETCCYQAGQGKT